jgi:hypothetical protein
MRKTVQETMTREVTQVICDRCGGPARRSCHACGRDLCVDCSTYDYQDFEDYPTRYCRECWEMGALFRTQIEDIKTKADAEIEALKSQWFAMCKKAVG